MNYVMIFYAFFGSSVCVRIFEANVPQYNFSSVISGGVCIVKRKREVKWEKLHGLFEVALLPEIVGKQV